MLRHWFRRAMRPEDRALVALTRKAKNILIAGHQNADPDAVCSAYALASFLLRVNPRAHVKAFFPEGPSKASKGILSRLQLAINEKPKAGDYDLIFTVDVNTLHQLGSLQSEVEGSGRPLVMIDHHAPHPLSSKITSLLICDEEATSTCEVVLDLYRRYGIKPNPKEAFAILTGLLHETAHLSLATSRTFKNVCELIALGANPEEGIEALRMPMDEPERIARLKGAQRLRVERYGRWIVALTHVGSYHASVARALIGLGANVAIAAGGEKGKLTVSMRSTKEFYGETGIHLGRDVAKPLGEELGGAGGGHPMAAGADVQGDVEEVLRRCAALIKAGIEGRKHRA